MSRYPLNLPQNLKQEAEEWAKQQGISLNQFILWATAEKVGELKQQFDDPRFPQVTYRRGAAGIPTPIVRGTGIRIQSIGIAHEQWGMTPQEIAAEYELAVNQVEEALAFFEAHRQEIDSNLLYEERLSKAEHV